METITDTFVRSNHIQDNTQHRSTMVNIKGMYECLQYDAYAERDRLTKVQSILSFNCYKNWFADELTAMGLDTTKTEY